jgi:hypothetical protein
MSKKQASRREAWVVYLIFILWDASFAVYDFADGSRFYGWMTIAGGVFLTVLALMLTRRR